MSDYNYTTDFLGKDALPSKDPGKIIKGSDYDFEFNKVQVAVNSKMDKTGGTFSGAVIFSDGLQVDEIEGTGGTLIIGSSTTVVNPNTDNNTDLGTSSKRWKEVWAVKVSGGTF